MDAVTLSNNTGIWPEICQDLSQRYQVLEAVNLLHYDFDMLQLWNQLQKYKDYCFSPTERLIFTLYDTDYYIPNSTLGFTIENLIRILNDLDISTGYCMLFTNHHGITPNINLRCKSDWPIHVFENNYSTRLTISTNKNNVSHSHCEIKKHFCFMSNTTRDHRSYIRQWIHDHRLEESTVMSWNNFKNKNISIDKTEYPVENFVASQNKIEFVYTSPFSRINDKITSKFMPEIYQNFSMLSQLVRNPVITTGPNQDNFTAPWLSSSFVNIVSESVFDYPYPYLTEKTFKCFWHKVPFIIVGATNSLKYLKSIGFKTFENWFDERYDNEVDPGIRMSLIVNELDKISKWSINDCQAVYNDMLHVLDYNFSHYYNYYCKTLLNQTLNRINELE